MNWQNTSVMVRERIIDDSNVAMMLGKIRWNIRHPVTPWKNRLTSLPSSPPPPLPSFLLSPSSTRATVHPTFPSDCCTWFGLTHATLQATNSKTPMSFLLQHWMYYTGTAKGTPSVRYIQTFFFFFTCSGLNIFRLTGIAACSH